MAEGRILKQKNGTENRSRPLVMHIYNGIKVFESLSTDVQINKTICVYGLGQQPLSTFAIWYSVP